MSESNVSQTRIDLATPTPAELDAAERVLAEAHGMESDGYFRSLALAALEAAKDAQLDEFMERCDDIEADVWDRALGEGRR